MPKRLYQIKDFSGGLNNLKDPADIADNQVSTSKGFMYNLQGIIQPAYSMALAANQLTSSTYSNNVITAVEPGYGLGYFETDHHVAVTVDSGTADGNTTNKLIQSGQNFSATVLVNDIAINTTDNTVGLVKAIDSDTTLSIKSFSGADKDLFPDGDEAYKIVSPTVKRSYAGNATDLGAGSVGIFYTDGAGSQKFQIQHLPTSDSIDTNFHTLYPVGTEIIISGVTAGTDAAITPQASAGIYKVVASGSGVISLDRSLLDDGSARTSAGMAMTIEAIQTGDKIILLANPTNHTIDIWSNGNGTSWIHNVISLYDSGETQTGISSKVRYYKVEDSIRCCDTTSNSNSSIKWYGYVSKTHFYGSLNPRPINRFIEAYNDLASPTNGDCVDGGTTPAVSTHPTAGNGFDFNIATNTSTEGLIKAGVYQFAQTFIYDSNQESLPTLYTPTEVTVDESDDFKVFSVNVGAEGDYNERISGGRIYIREKDSQDEWILLIDIDLVKGCRTNLTEEHTIWDLDGTSGDSYNCPDQTAGNNFIIKDLNFITYETINGFPSSIFSVDMGNPKEKWKDSIVTNNRVFVCNVEIKDENKGKTKKESTTTNFKDRIMYSMPNRYDTFPYFNFIEAAKGDADHYVAIDAFGDRLLAFKRFSLDIINISSPSDSNWFLEMSKQYQGVEHPEAVKKTQYGVVWANKQGLFLYDGSTIRNLSENLLADSVWASHVDVNTGIIYDEQESMVFVVASMSDNGDAYMYDLRKGSFSFIADFILDTNDGITNTVDTEDNNTYYAHDGGSITDIYQMVRASVTHNDQEVITKNIDFGDSSRLKKVYAIYITFKSDVNISDNVFYSINGGNNWIAASGSSSTSSTVWQHGKWVISSPPSTSKIMIKVDTGEASKVYINDIGIEYRTIHKRMG